MTRITFSACTTNLCRVWPSTFLRTLAQTPVNPVRLQSTKVHERSNSSPGTSNCSWTSCREGCTKELYDCTQIRVNYKLPTNTSEDSDGQGEGGGAVGGVEDDEDSTTMGKPRYERSLREYDYVEDLDEDFAEDDDAGLPKPFPTGTERRALPFTSSLLLVNATITVQYQLSSIRWPLKD
ncbi:hypothetical protein K0M31_012281 [Melipona bicolor]|uniref:Uncharacterized protein n=1 Tax=Melipona bicolor TaxID=60889 RepID=A0AA40FL47_9HYME|nr:hypothetical protein K0M31_012281 [Melipona bicolor]